MALDDIAAPRSDDGTQGQVAWPVRSLYHARQANGCREAKRNGLDERSPPRIHSCGFAGNGSRQRECGRRVTGRKRHERSIVIVESAAEGELVLGLYAREGATGDSLGDSGDRGRERDRLHVVRGESAQRRRVSRRAADVKQSARQKRSITAQEGDVSRRVTNALAVSPIWFIEFAECRAIERRENDGGDRGSAERDDVSPRDQSRRGARDDRLRIDRRAVRGRVTRDTGAARDGRRHLRAGVRREAHQWHVGREERGANQCTSGSNSGS